MALELSQAELLDFLCQSGGRVANAALVGHFRRFLRDPEAGPEELQRRRDQFKGFVNSVATVKTEGTGPAAKYVVLRKRYRELVGEEGKAPPDQCRRAALHHPGGEELGCRASSAQPKGGQPGKEAPLGPRLPYIGPPAPQREKQPPRELNGTLPEASLGLRGLAPVSEGLILPVSGMGQGGTQQRIQDWVATHHSPTETIPSVTTLHSPIATNSCPTLDPISFPIIEMGAPPSQGGTQQRIQDWVATHHSPTETNPCPTLDPIAFPILEMGAPPSQGGITQQRIQDWMATHPAPDSDNASSLTSGLHRASRDPLPVFRSIRCQLSLQDLEDFIEKESSASEEGSSASGGSDSHRTEGHTGSPLPRLGVRSRIEATRTIGPKGLNTKPYANGPRGMAPPAKQNGTIPGRLVSVPQSVQGNKPRGKEAEQPNADLPKAKKIARAPPPPNLDALLSPQLVSKQGRATNKPDLDRLAPDIDGSSEHRSSLVPLEPREHAWLVKVATGSWMQARALLLEDPYLATRKDFISGYTVLHWLAKHGNVQVLLDVVTGAKKAGVPLDVNVKSGCGYTPLHLAAMHGHQLVIKVLVQKLQCHVQVRDGSGKRPWQYLSSATSGEVWQLLGAPRGKTIFPARPITRPNNNSPARKGKSPELGRKISRTASLAAYLKPQHIKWKRGNKCPPLHEREEYSD